LPAPWVDRLFARFVAIYGTQKVGAMWLDASMNEVKSVWADQLGRFAPESIAGALQRLVDSSSAWPPTLPEFVELCRQASLGRVAGALPTALPARGQAYTDREAAKRKIAGLLATLARAKRMPVE